jgi:hypothetical protein
MGMSNPYRDESGSIRFLPSIVLYADILGYSRLSNEAIQKDGGLEFLEKIRVTLSKVYDLVRERSNIHGKRLLYVVKVFTDNIIIGYPLKNLFFDFGETELGDILITFTEVQAGLAKEGFFIRGGISVGNHYMDEDIVFGEALLEAVGQDKSGSPPRLILSKSVQKLIEHQLSFYDDVRNSPHYEDLLMDADESIYLNYLKEAFYHFKDGWIDFEIIEGHQKAIAEGLKTYQNNVDIRAKFEWAACYHNYICHEFAENHRVSSDPNANEIHCLACIEAQKLLDYMIDVETKNQKPRRINLEPAKRKRI